MGWQIWRKLGTTLDSWNMWEGVWPSPTTRWGRNKISRKSVVMLWFNFIIGLNFIFLCVKLVIINYHTPKQRKINQGWNWTTTVRVAWSKTWICNCKFFPSNNRLTYNEVSWMKHAQIHRCTRAQCLELKQRNPRLFITCAQVTAILYLAGFLTKYVAERVATKNCSHLSEERPNGKVSCILKSHYRKKSSGKIESIEKEGRRREKEQWLHSVFKLASLSEKKKTMVDGRDLFCLGSTRF